jgi:hypothetical protein
VAGVDASPAAKLEGAGTVLTYYAGSTPIAGASTAAGTYTVVASFLSGAEYPATAAQATFAIAPATPTITWNNLTSIVYGGVIDV